MLLPMRDQSWLLRETLAAHVAHVRPDAGVGQQMLLTRALAPEGFVADRAAVRRDAVVNPHVVLQSVVAAEGLTAYLAHEALPTIVQLAVLLQRFLRRELPPAHVARESTLAVEVTLVFLESERIPIGLAAQVADRLATVTVNNLHVHIQIALDLEALVARVAHVILTLMRMLPPIVISQRLPAFADGVALAARIRVFGSVRLVHVLLQLVF